MTMAPTDRRMLARARSLRSNMTGPERALWRLLRSRQLAGLKFRRQHPIGPVVVDFYCHSARIVVELDGMSHDDTAQADARRSAYLEQAGVCVLRVMNDDVISDPDVVAEWIAKEAAIRISTDGAGEFTGRRPPSPQPSPGGRGSVGPPSPQPSPGGRGSVGTPSPQPSPGGRGSV